MTREPPDREPFDAEERRALEAWSAPQPPADFTRRVLAAAAAPAARRPRRLALAVGTLAAIGLVAWFVLAGDARMTGARSVDRRATLHIGRSVVVAEPGTALRWELRGGRALVQQPRGNAFYRVARGGRFEVRTPLGAATVLGTCFRVEVKAMNKPSKTHLVAAGAGAAVATLVLVTVYEGRVLVASPRGQLELAAGEAAAITPGTTPRRAERGAGRPATATAGPRGAADPRRAAGPAAELAALRQENERLRAEVESLRPGGVVGACRPAPDKFLELTKDELAYLAQRCELRWDMAPLGSDPPRVRGEAVKELGLDEGERAGLEKALADHHRHTITALRTLYGEVTGDRRAAELLSPEALVSEIEDKSPPDEVKRVFAQLARERAGLAAAPAAHTEASAAERLFRLLTTAGDRLERAMGAEVGPDLARRYRELRGGFGSRHRSRHGCPDPSPSR